MPTDPEPLDPKAATAAPQGGPPGKDPVGGSCEFVRDGSVYLPVSCNCATGYHQPDPPIVDDSAPDTITLDCEKDSE